VYKYCGRKRSREVCLICSTGSNKIVARLGTMINMLKFQSESMNRGNLSGGVINVDVMMMLNGF
jgi:hypothetical protein